MILMTVNKPFSQLSDIKNIHNTFVVRNTDGKVDSKEVSNTM